MEEGVLPSTDELAEPTSSRRAVAGAGLLVLVWTYCALTLLALHFRHDYVSADDGPYHVAMAQVLRERGITRHFEWTQLSVWKDRFADKEFLFHVALIPFCAGDPGAALRGGKLFVVLVGLAVFVAFSLILRAHEVPAPWLWTLALLVSSSLWLFRMSLLRPHILSVLLALLAIHGFLTGRAALVAVLGFVYPWTYSAPQIILAIGAIIVATRRLTDGHWQWRPFAAAAGGLAAGMIVHPYFPNNLLIWWIQNPLVLLRAWNLGGPPEIEVGMEFQPGSTRLFVYSSTLGVLLFAGVNIAAAVAPKRLASKTISLLVLTWVFLFLHLLSVRFTEYYLPTVVLTAALVSRELWPEMRAWLPDWTRRRPAQIAAAVLLGAFLLGCNYRVNRELFPLFRAGKPWNVGASAWTKANLPRGARILHLGWDQFPELFLRDREHRYLVAMDPMFGYFAYPKEMTYLERVRNDRQSSPPPRELSAKLGGRYLIIEKRRWKHADALEAAGAKRLYDDETAAVFDLTPG